MTEVKLLQNWTDASGVSYTAGDKITVDNATGSTLVSSGIAEWVGMTGTKDREDV